ncbi:MAG: ABC transporter substrate-binding protein [Chloroflexi bacterium]|nr:ABC transporter substrate-binding protein [Chloroflexota bacterium]
MPLHVLSSGHRRRVLIAALGILALLAAACGPAATATPTSAPPTIARPTLAPTSPPVTGTTPTPTRAAGVTPSPTTPTPAPTAAPPTGAAAPKAGGVLKTYLRSEIAAWDPVKEITGSFHLRSVEKSVFSSLLARYAEETPCADDYNPVLVKSWKWVDNTTLEVVLQQGIKFHNKPPVNGRELTAEDVIWSWQRILAVNPRLQAVKDGVKEIVAVDRYTVRFITSTPLPALPPALGESTTPNILAKEAGDFAKDAQWGDWTLPEKSYIGSGPFMFKQNVPGVKVVLEKHPDYFKKGQPYLNGVEFHVLPDMSTRTAALISGKIDVWYAEAPIAPVQTLRKTAPQMWVQQCPLLQVPVMAVGRTDQAPFNDVRVRRAVLLAMDQAGMIKTAFLGEGAPSGVLPAFGSAVYLTPKEFPPELRKYLEPNPSESKKLLAEAGFPNGFETTVTYYPGYGSPFNEITEAFVSALADVGIKARQRGLERGAYNTTKSTGNFEGILLTKQQVYEPTSAFDMFYSKTPPALNVGRTNDPELDPLIEEYWRTVDKDKSLDLAKRIQYRILDQAWNFQLPAQFDYSIGHPYVKGYIKGGYESTTGPKFERVWLDK